MPSEKQIEQEIQAKGLTRPRLTPQDVDDAIKDETYTTLPSGKVMVCELTLQNGFTVRGEAAVVSKENFNEDIGRKISRENARNKIWELEGYLLQQRLHEASQIPVDANFIGGLTSGGTIEPLTDSDFRASAKDSGC
ncbi:MAG: Gp49 family protein [Pseudomonadota bacterium]|nr:Gp49 family protein [Pseudomonadota bacterium]